MTDQIGPLGGQKNVRSLDEARKAREAAQETPQLPADGLAPLVAPPAAQEPTVEAQEPHPAPPEGPEAPADAPRQAYADQIVMFVSADGLRRFEQVGEPFIPPPRTIELKLVGRQKMIQLPGQDEAVETRAYAFVQSVQIPSLGLLVHHFQER